MKKWSRMIKTTLGVEEKTFQGTGRKLGDGKPTNASQSSSFTHNQGARDPDSGSSQPYKVRQQSSTAAKDTRSTDTTQDFQKQVVASIQHSECEQAMAEMLQGQRRNEVDLESFRIILKVLKNILESDVTEAKMRKLRLRNPKIDKYIVNASGAMELLLGCGFELVFEASEKDTQEEGTMVLPLDAEKSSLETIRRVVTAIERLLGIQTTVSSRTAHSSIASKGENGVADNDEVMPPETRATILELPTPIEADVPSWFFEQSSAEIKQLYKQNKEKIESGKILMTKAMREKLAKRNEISCKSSNTTIRIRVRAPEGTKIVGDFHKKEPIQALFSWVSDCLVDPMLEFDLILPDRKKLGDSRFEQKCLLDVGLAASQTLNLCWQGESIQFMKYKPAFRENL